MENLEVGQDKMVSAYAMRSICIGISIIHFVLVGWLISRREWLVLPFTVWATSMSVASWRHLHKLIEDNEVRTQAKLEGRDGDE